MSVASGMELDGEAAARAAEALGLLIPLLARRHNDVPGPRCCPSCRPSHPALPSRRVSRGVRRTRPSPPSANSAGTRCSTCPRPSPGQAILIRQVPPLRPRPRHPQHAFKAETVILRETTPAPALRRQQRPDGRRCPQKSGPGRRLRPGPSHQTGWVRATRPLVARLLTLWLRGVCPLLGRSGPAGSGCLLQLSCIRIGDTLDQAAERRERAEQLCGMGWVDTIAHAPL